MYSQFELFQMYKLLVIQRAALLTAWKMSSMPSIVSRAADEKHLTFLVYVS